MATLINTPHLRKLYNDAESDRHESYATRFFSYFLQKVAFPDDKFWISPEQPPTDDHQDRRRVDLVVNYFSPDNNVRVLCFTEVKRGQATEKAIEENEEQAITAASSYCRSFSLPYVYVMSTFGAKARFFSYGYEEDRYHVMLPGDDVFNVADKRAYMDPDTQSGTAYWLRAFEVMKRQPPTLMAGEQSAQPQWSQPNVGVRAAPTPVVASSERETNELQHQVDRNGSALFTTHGIGVRIPKDTHFSVDGTYYEWTGDRMYRHATPRSDVNITFISQGQMLAIHQLSQGVWWKQDGNSWVRA